MTINKLNVQYIFLLVLLCIAVLLSQKALAITDLSTLSPVDTTAIQSSIGRANYNRRTRAYNFPVTLTNVSTVTVENLQALVIEGLSVPSSNVINETDTSTTGQPLFNLGGITLAPGATKTVNVGIINNSRTRVSFTTRVFKTPVITDTSPPLVTISSPAENTVLTNSPITVTGTATDANLAGVTVNGVNAQLGTNNSYSVAIPLALGVNTLTAVATDKAGNTATVSIQVTRQQEVTDTTPPNLTLVTPVNGSLVTDPKRQIQLQFSDAGGIDQGSLAFSIDGVPFDTTCVFNTADIVCTPTANYPEGSVTLTAELQDLAGNKATKNSSFTVDSEPVQISITSPANEFITKATEIKVDGTVATDVTSVKVNDVDATVNGGAFTVTVPLREGKNMIVAVGVKNSGKTGTDSVDITRDNANPIVRIQTPADGFNSANNKIAIAGSVNDVINGGKSPKVIVNGIEATVANSAFMITDLQLVPGPNTITAIATDAVGNVGKHTISVNFQKPVGARLQIAAGNGQAGVVNSQLDQPLTVSIKDDAGNPVAARTVKFKVTRNNGTLQGSGSTPSREFQVPTNGSGQASVKFNLGDTAGEGNNRIMVSALGVTGAVEFCATGLPSPAQKILMIAGDNQRGTIGNPLATPLAALVVDKDGNPINGIDVTFQVVKGGGLIDGGKLFVRTTTTDGVARAVLTLGPEAGINNNVVAATFPGLKAASATFVASGLKPGNPADTQFSGVVLGSGGNPVPGVLVSIKGSTSSDTTDSQGQFLLNNVPVGHIDLEIDPTNTTRPETFSKLAFETITVSGQNNILGQPIILPFIQTESSKLVGGDQDVILTMPGVPGLSLKVFAHSTTFPDGSKTGPMTISQVHLDKVPMAPPKGTIFMPPAWTVQPVGTLFDPPAQVTIPNNGLPPGTVIDIFTFDHVVNEFLNVGKATVSEDGLVVVSDPGFGITKAGWGGGGPPPPPRTCLASCDDNNKCTTDSLKNPPCVCDNKPTNEGMACGGDNAGSIGDGANSCTVGVCTGGKCDGIEKAVGSTCDDGLFCTSASGNSPGNDSCITGGKCDGKKIERKTLGGIGQDYDLTALKTILKGAAEAVNFVPGCMVDKSGFNITAGIKVELIEDCCEKKKKIAKGENLTGSASVNLPPFVCKFPTPLTIGVASVKVSAGVGLNGSVSASADSSPCNDGACNSEISGTIGLTLSGGVEAELIDEDVVSVTAGVRGPGFVKYSDKCGQTSWQACAGSAEIFGEAVLVKFVKKSIAYTIPHSQICTK